MPSGQALAQHLQVLQSGRSLNAPWHDAPIGAVGILQPPSEELFSDVEVADTKRLQEVVRTAEFWIALLEGERSDLVEEVVKQKQRQQLADRQANTKATALREAETEKKRLETELKRLQESRDQAIIERALTKEDAKKLQQSKSAASRTEQDVDELATRSRALEDSLKKEFEEKSTLEEMLVRSKVKLVEALQRADSMEVLIGFYEDKLTALDPNFQRQDLSALQSQWMLGGRRGDSEVESNSGASDFEETQTEVKKKGLGGFKQAASKAQKAFRIGGLFQKKSKASKNESTAQEDAAEATPRGSARPDGSPRSEEGEDECSTTPAKAVAEASSGPKPRWMLRSEQ